MVQRIKTGPLGEQLACGHFVWGHRPIVGNRATGRQRALGMERWLR